MGSVVKFTGPRYRDLPSEVTLDAVKELKPKHVFIICWPEDGGMPTFFSNTWDVTVVLYQLQRFIHKLFNGEFGAED